MKGYKALDMDMKAVCGNGMQFKLGKTYSVEGKIIPCENGFHFCDKIEKLNMCYNIISSRIFEVEAEGDIMYSDNKYVARSIALVRELTKEEINNYFKQNLQALVNHANRNIRLAVAEQGLGLDILVHDKDCDIRIAVAEQDYGLDILIKDESCFVRCAVAEQGYGLDKLVHDEDCDVRAAVAEQGYELDKLICDESCCVRVAVAKQGYRLDRLIDDENEYVRRAVAEQGYGLDILIHDKKLAVRNMARKMLNKKMGCQ